MKTKQKFQIGDKVALTKQPYTLGTIVDIFNEKTLHTWPNGNTYTKTRKKYVVRLECDSSVLHHFLSYELKFADIHSLAKHAEKYGDIPKLSKKEKEETKEYHVEFFEINDIVKINSQYNVPFPGMGKICAKRLDLELNVKFYDVELIDKSRKTFLAHELIMASPNDIAYYNELCAIRDHARQASDIKDTKNPINSHEIHDETVSFKFNKGDIVSIKIHDILSTKKHVVFPYVGKIDAKISAYSGYNKQTYKSYNVIFYDGSSDVFSESELYLAPEVDVKLYNRFLQIKETTSILLNKEKHSKCKYCGTPFDEIEESQEELGACEYCIERRGLISNVVGRKSAYVDLHKFSGLAHDGDWIEVTEWTNREGFDIMIHYASDHDEDDRTFKMSYEELEAIMNIINKFGMLPPVYTKEQEN